MNVEPSFAQWSQIAQELTPYAVQFRYPSDVLEPESSEAERAVECAAALLDFVVQWLPAEVRQTK
jgi:hypothetical protein